MDISRLAVRGISSAALVAALFFAIPSALAQSNAPSPQELNPVQRAPIPQAGTAGKGDLLSPPEAGPCPLRDSALQFTLTSVTFHGANAISLTDLEQSYRDYIGTKMSVSGICDIRDRASVMLFRKGILARVEIPAQKISGGQLVLEVIEAYVAGVDVHGDVGPAKGKVAEYVEMLRGMRPFDINKAQRYLFLASDVPGIHISATLKPSPRGRGAIILDIAVTRDSWNALLNVQNLGSSSVGPFGALARVDFNSFTPYGDRTTIVAYSTFEPQQQRVLQGVEELRLGSDGLMARVSVAWGKTHPGSDLAVLGLKGESLVTEASLSYPLVRSRRLNLNISGGMEFIEQNVDVALVLPLTRDKLRVLDARLSGNYKWYDGIPGSVALGIELRQGLDILGASTAGSPLLSRVEGKPDALEFRSDGQLTLFWTPYLSTYTGYMAQYTDQPLLAYEELAVGNLTIGRGYDPSVISGDRGVAGSFELRLGQFPIYRDFSGGVMGFFDIARVENLDTGSFNRTLRSVGGGVTVQIGSHLHLDVTYAKPLDKISPLAASKPSDRVLVSLTAGL